MVGVEVRTLQQKVFNSLRDVPAPGAVGVRGLTEAVQVNRECRVPKCKKGGRGARDQERVRRVEYCRHHYLVSTHHCTRRRSTLLFICCHREGLVRCDYQG
ncbi:hypothetical protein GWK47_041568 [Chionoecetes opilio]|uniref:Uncharacterized protein n=1 Tax=Chionoecetes opilio TaxID=41210 RepID=A0A8J4YIE8_CHIOP|nr:hypothetical protein GWK47_041568 [Chionoecetes opilio]